MEEIETLIDQIPRIHDAMEKANAIERCQSILRQAKGTKRSYKMETRLIVDPASRRKYESRLATFDQQLKTLSADAKALEAELQRGELFVESRSGENGHGDDDGIDAVKAGDQILNDAARLQDKTQDSLSNTKNLIAQSKEVGVSTLEELERQRNVIDNIDREVTRIDDNLARAEALLKQFGKRMATDKFIQCFAVVNCLLLLGVLLYIVLKPGGVPNPLDGAPIQPARLLRAAVTTAVSEVTTTTTAAVGTAMKSGLR